ncbi:hypothetical protein [Amantichitinum ursilacus]|uniref:Preprotein translocase subunit SecD n=1 Tax=Amantichitinum ursilacus TaxID=857265 RepID=A0A0N0GQ00_9NEIS|nr:hypothetical protein [Amantichitinum ursilacus]KPC54192.1 hypothetical protein WG78_06065 [Amantichitinum ursilacus]
MRAEQLLPDHINQTVIDGVTVRKGTVGAFLANARVWCDVATSASQRAAIEADLLQALPALRALGLFEVLDIRNADLRAWVAAH